MCRETSSVAVRRLYYFVNMTPLKSRVDISKHFIIHTGIVLSPQPSFPFSSYTSQATEKNSVTLTIFRDKCGICMSHTLIEKNS